jgi:hypothetical protein
MIFTCVCQWQSCSIYSKAFEENSHVLSKCYSISYGVRTSHVRKMIEQHLSVDDDVVKRKAVYRVAYHHWPELLILRNMNEKRSISKLISREEAGNYGNEFVNSSELPNDATLDDSSQMHVQAPTVSEIDVSTLVASLYRTPEKPAAVDCGVSFPFSTVDVDPPPPMLHPMRIPSKSTAKPAFECSLPYFPSNLFNNSPSIRQLTPAMLPPTQPASNDPPSNDLVNLPASEFISVDCPNDSLNPNTEVPTRPTPIDCCVLISSPPLHPAESNPNHLPLNPTIDCCVPTIPTMPDSPDAYLSVNKIHEYIKRKVMQHGISDELLTIKFSAMVKILQCIHRNFEPILCQHGSDFKNVYVYPCPGTNQDNHDTPCQLLTIRLYLQKKGYELPDLCKNGKKTVS